MKRTLICDKIERMETDLLATVQKRTLKHNCIAAIAHANKRDYITPEDIRAAFKTHSLAKVRKDTLEILGEHAGFGAEDAGCCAHTAVA